MIRNAMNLTDCTKIGPSSEFANKCTNELVDCVRMGPKKIN